MRKNENIEGFGGWPRLGAMKQRLLPRQPAQTASIKWQQKIELSGVALKVKGLSLGILSWNSKNL
jgi:hypothetical protein